jgi:hypothetical protein
MGGVCSCGQHFGAINIEFIISYTHANCIPPPGVYIDFRVILESAYSLYDRAFADNLTTILLYAVVVSD